MKTINEIEAKIYSYDKYIKTLKEEIENLIVDLRRRGERVNMNCDYIGGRELRISQIEAKKEALLWVMS